MSDDLICSFQEKGKRRNRVCGQQEKVQWRTNVPSEALKFVRCKMKGKENRTVLVRPNRNSFPGKEWCIPSCLVRIEKGVVYVLILNLSRVTLEFKPKDRLTVLEFSYDAKVQVIENADLLQNGGIVKEEKGEEHVCAAVHYEPRRSQHPKKKFSWALD